MIVQYCQHTALLELCVCVGVGGDFQWKGKGHPDFTNLLRAGVFIISIWHPPHLYPHNLAEIHLYPHNHAEIHLYLHNPQNPAFTYTTRRILLKFESAGKGGYKQGCILSWGLIFIVISQLNDIEKGKSTASIPTYIFVFKPLNICSMALIKPFQVFDNQYFLGF